MAETDTNGEAFLWDMILGKLEPELRDLFNQIRNIDRGCALIRFLDGKASTLMTIDDEDTSMTFVNGKTDGMQAWNGLGK